MPTIKPPQPLPGLVASTPGLVAVSPTPTTTAPVASARSSAIGATSPELQGSDFILLAEPKAQTVGIVFAKDGHGKCLGRDVLVMMSDGSIKPVQDVRVGDLLMGPDSQPREVLRLGRGRDQMYRIVPNKGDSWTCNSVHILTLVDSITGNVFDIPLNEYLELNPTGRVRHNALLLRTALKFEPQPTVISPYVMGVWLGDGTRGRPDITTSKPEVISELIAEASRLGLRLTEHPDQRCNTSLWCYAADPGKVNPVRVETRRAVTEDGSFKTIPVEYLINSEESRLELLAGLLDTDGHLFDSCYEIITKSPLMASEITFLARSLGFAANTKEKNAKLKGRDMGVYYRIIISGHTDQIPCRTKRAAPRQQTKNVLRVGFRVEPIGEGDYYGFTLAGDGRFLLWDTTVTHNTWFTVNSCPEPVVLIGLDRRGERAAKEAMKRGRKVYYLDAAMPANVIQMSHEQAQEHGKRSLDLITKNYEWAVDKSIREWGKGTVAFDTSTELRDIARVAVRGRVDRPNPKTGEKGDFGKSDALINQTLKYFCDRARDSNLNLVLLSRARPIYEGREDTGRVTWDTDKIFSQAADWIVEYRMVGQMVGGGIGPVQLLGVAPIMSSGPTFEMQVTQPKLNIEEMGKVYRQAEWGTEGPFSYLCTRVVPGSRVEDWK